MLQTFHRSIIRYSAATFCLVASVPTAFAGIFGEVPDIGAGSGDNVRGTITGILKTILSYMALVAVIVIVLAGIRMVVSQGDEGAVDKAKKTLLYAIIGLIIILLASAIVTIIASF
ncbi:MAG: TrbC/VirB2 family protein, partial [Candidatus Peribacteraceae bacterium]